MADRADLEKAERRVSQLPFVDRLKLVARICEQLSVETTGVRRLSSQARARLRIAPSVSKRTCPPHLTCLPPDAPPPVTSLPTGASPSLCFS